MDDIQEVISRFGLQQDHEHVIIPVYDADGKPARCFLLKRRFIRIQFRDGHLHDYPLHEIIEAIILHSDLPLTESILLVHKEIELHADGSGSAENPIRGEGEEENTY